MNFITLNLNKNVDTATMSHAELLSQAQKLKEHYEKQKKYNLELSVKLNRVQVRESRLVKEF